MDHRIDSGQCRARTSCDVSLVPEIHHSTATSAAAAHGGSFIFDSVERERGQANSRVSGRAAIDRLDRQLEKFNLPSLSLSLSSAPISLPIQAAREYMKNMMHEFRQKSRLRRDRPIHFDSGVIIVIRKTQQQQSSPVILLPHNVVK